jgi:hypothetical protein
MCQKGEAAEFIKIIRSEVPRVLAKKKPTRKQKGTERKGFEPSIRVNVYTLSKRAPSTARPPLQTAPSNSEEKSVPLTQNVFSFTESGLRDSEKNLNGEEGIRTPGTVTCTLA